MSLLGVFAIAPRVPTIGERVAPFRDAYQWTAFALVSLGLLVLATIVAWNSGLQFGGGQSLLTRVGALVAAVLLYSGAKALPALEQNRLVGIRSPWTMADETVWSQTHEHAVPFFKTAAAIAVLAAAAPSEIVALALIVAPLLSVLGYLYYYSYRLYDG
ncbi:SdpI family protein [Halomicroarcula sp. S1AR25-4]|uniref:SdpI family protein n=1 Tax=Haloarcula sp. S1AR25-4 TaxID=2950538 RepID=UPI002874FE66|nr:SdpI family protein [Halomicroarcula sp. S1AR25-4]MDS0279491.1 SdpI family protein [Halomicroarcula sp. S1AR25-4]